MIAINRIFANDPAKIQRTEYQCSEDLPFYTGKAESPCINCPNNFNWDTK